MVHPSRMLPLPNTPFSMLHSFVMEERGDRGGCICPVCQAHNVVKKYKMTELHFRQLRRLATHGLMVDVHWKNFVDRDSSTKMLQIPKHYGVIGQRTQNPTNPFNRSGEWYITQRGLDFIGGRCRLPLYFWSIHDVPLWWSNELRTISELPRSRGRFATLIEEMTTAALNEEMQDAGQFREEYL